MKILAIDPATSCGFAHSGGASGTWDLSIRRDESSGMRLIRMRGKLEEIYRAIGIDIVLFEAARGGFAKRLGALVVSSEIQAAIKLWCEDNQIEYRGFSPAEVKKHATGKGNANKAAMVAAAQRRWPELNLADDEEDRADALWILDLGQRTIGTTSGPELPGPNARGGEPEAKHSHRELSDMASASSDRKAPLVSKKKTPIFDPTANRDKFIEQTNGAI